MPLWDHLKSFVEALAEPSPEPIRCELCHDATARLKFHDRRVCLSCFGGHEWSTDERRFLFSLAFIDYETPADGDPGETITLGVDDDGAAVLIPHAPRFRHTYAIGKNGSGKTTLLVDLIAQDIAAGRGVVFLDPHGDAARQLLDLIPPERADDVVYFSPTDPACPVLNIMGLPFAPDKLCSDIISIFQLLGGDSWGPRLQRILTYAVVTLLLDRRHQPHCINDVKTMLVDEEYRGAIVSRSTIPDVVSFWDVQFSRFPKDACDSVLTKLDTFLTPASPIRHLFTATTNGLDLPAIMNGGKILLCNLSKGEIGNDPAFFLGALITTAIMQTALARSKIPEADRVRVFFYCDEFQNFAVDSFQSVLSEARKYRLHATLAHQFLNQISKELRSAIFGNAAVMVCMQISNEDAQTMRGEFSSTFDLDPLDPLPTLGELPPPRTRPIPYRRSEARERVREHMRQLAIRTLHNRDPINREWRFGILQRLAAQYEDPTRYPNTLDRLLDGPDVYGNKPSPLKDTEWPTLEDFRLVPDFAGFVKVSRADTTQRFSVRPPTIHRPHPDVARSILDRQRAEHEAARVREADEPPPPPPPTSDPEDFSKFFT